MCVGELGLKAHDWTVPALIALLTTLLGVAEKSDLEDRTAVEMDAIDKARSVVLTARG